MPRLPTSLVLSLLLCLTAMAAIGWFSDGSMLERLRNALGAGAATGFALSALTTVLWIVQCVQAPAGSEEPRISGKTPMVLAVVSVVLLAGSLTVVPL